MKIDNIIIDIHIITIYILASIKFSIIFVESICLVVVKVETNPKLS